MPARCAEGAAIVIVKTTILNLHEIKVLPGTDMIGDKHSAYILQPEGYILVFKSPVEDTTLEIKTSDLGEFRVSSSSKFTMTLEEK